MKSLGTFLFLLIVYSFGLYSVSYFSYRKTKFIHDEKQSNNQINNNYPQNRLKGNMCPLCNFTPLYPPSSTRRDVVLAAALNQIERAEIFIRTLRMTGSKCRIILFLDRQKIQSYYLHFFDICDVEPVFVNNLNNMVLIKGSKMARYYYYHQWLSEHINEVDRILHSDTFDVFFQSDPFRNEMIPSNFESYRTHKYSIIENGIEFVK